MTWRDYHSESGRELYALITYLHLCDKRGVTPKPHPRLAEARKILDEEGPVTGGKPDSYMANAAIKAFQMISELRQRLF
jgi:hypothetical protein